MSENLALKLHLNCELTAHAQGSTEAYAAHMAWQVHNSGQQEESGHNSGSGSAHEAAGVDAESGGVAGASAGRGGPDAANNGQQRLKDTGIEPPPRQKTAETAAGTANLADLYMKQSLTPFSAYI